MRILATVYNYTDLHYYHRSFATSRTSLNRFMFSQSSVQGGPNSSNVTRPAELIRTGTQGGRETGQDNSCQRAAPLAFSISLNLSAAAGGATEQRRQTSTPHTTTPMRNSESERIQSGQLKPSTEQRSTVLPTTLPPQLESSFSVASALSLTPLAPASIA